MSIAFYSRQEPDATVRASTGFKIGALAGLFGFLMNAFLSTSILLSATARSALRVEMANRVKEAIAASTDPSSTEILRKVSDQLNTPAGLAILFVVAMVLLGVFFVLLSGIGGAIGASLFGHRRS
ncbi:MAG: hypothetical protein ACM3JD_00525 [Rudaea sp.]